MKNNIKMKLSFFSINVPKHSNDSVCLTMLLVSYCGWLSHFLDTDIPIQWLSECALSNN